MIHYHGGPLGKAAQSHEFFAGRHSLISFAHRSELETMAEVSHSFVLDNGAFSVWKSGKSLDVQGYTDWVDDWRRHPGFDWALIPDVINGSEDQNDGLIEDWPYTRDGVPVWHLNESLDRLDRLSLRWDRVAFGSTEGMEPGSKQFWTRIAQAMDVLCDDLGRPRCKLHGLRMLDPRIFQTIPLASADSASAATRSFMPEQRFGIYLPRKESQRANIIADRVEAYNSAPLWNNRITVQTEFKLCGQ
jgi:hypothetical protein